MSDILHQIEPFSFLVLADIVKRLDGHINLSCLHAFACDDAPLLAWSTPNDRVEIVVAGDVDMLFSLGNGQRDYQRLQKGDVLRITANGWNLPCVNEAKTLSICCRGDKLGLSYNHWKDGRCISLAKWAMSFQSISTLIENIGEPQALRLGDVNLHTLLHVISIQFRAYPVDVSRQKKMFHQVLTYIRCHFNQSICRESVADHFCISSSYLSHLFQQYSDIGFNEYINRERFAHASHLLVEKGMQVKKVALESGFVDADYFCRQFKRLAGMTPTQYRQQHALAEILAIEA